MGFFSKIASGIRNGNNAYRKESTRQRIILELYRYEESGAFSGDLGAFATELTETIWQKYQRLLGDDISKKPHHTTLAAVAIANAVDMFPYTSSNRSVMVAALKRSLERNRSEAVNIQLGVFDLMLIETASQILKLELDDNFGYENYADWFIDFKIAASVSNPALILDDKGSSLIDFMDQAPLKRAFNDRVCPKALGRDFGKSYKGFS